MFHPVPQPADDGLHGVFEGGKDFSPAGAADILVARRIARVHVEALDGRPRLVGRALTRVAAEGVEQQLHHVALAVVRWRCMGKNQEFHSVRPIRKLDGTRHSFGWRDVIEVDLLCAGIDYAPGLRIIQPLIPR